MLLFAGIGLLAGLPGKDKIKISCSECGYLFDAGTAVKIPISEKAKADQMQLEEKLGRSVISASKASDHLIASTERVEE